MRQDDEYGKKARNDYFSLFEEAYRNPNVRRWLAWDESENCFQNQENLRTFYSWITPDEDDQDERRRLHNPRHVKSLGMLLEGDNRSLIAKVDRHEMGIESAEYAAEEVKPTEDWRERLRGGLDAIKSLPAEVIAEHPEEYHGLLVEMRLEIERFMAMAEALMGGEHESE